MDFFWCIQNRRIVAVYIALLQLISRPTSAQRFVFGLFKNSKATQSTAQQNSTSPNAPFSLSAPWHSSTNLRGSTQHSNEWSTMSAAAYLMNAAGINATARVSNQNNQIYNNIPPNSNNYYQMYNPNSVNRNFPYQNQPYMSQQGAYQQQQQQQAAFQPQQQQGMARMYPAYPQMGGAQNPYYQYANPAMRQMHPQLSTGSIAGMGINTNNNFNPAANAYNPEIPGSGSAPHPEVPILGLPVQTMIQPAAMLDPAEMPPEPPPVSLPTSSPPTTEFKYVPKEMTAADYVSHYQQGVILSHMNGGAANVPVAEIPDLPAGSTRSKNNIRALNIAPCSVRKDGKFACLPDVILIGVSRAAIGSLCQYLDGHPMVQNILSDESIINRQSIEGNFWDVEKGREAEGGQSHDKSRSAVDPAGTVSAEPLSAAWIKQTMKAYLDVQDGFDHDIRTAMRPIMIEYSPGYLALDHVPRLLHQKSVRDYRMKFIVALRDPVKRTISSWKAQFLNDPETTPFLNESIAWGIAQAGCVDECFKKEMTMKDCSIEFCRKKFDPRPDGRGGGLSSVAHVVKSMYAHQLLHWRSYFPKKRYFIFTIEEFEAHPIGMLERILDFLGLPLYDPGAGSVGYKDREEIVKLLKKRKNKSPLNAKADQQITKESVELLYNFFKPHNKLLNEVLGWSTGYPSA